jgi:hypothetical protein
MQEAPLSPHDVRAAAEVHAELGPDYGDAVVESFLAKLDKQIEARVEERLAAIPARQRRPVDPVQLSKRRHALAGAGAGAVAAGVPLSIMAVHAMAGFGTSGEIAYVWAPLVIIFGALGYRLRRHG